MNLTNKSINHLRVLSAEMITNAKSGHPGVALGAATIMYALFKDHYFFDVNDHKFFSRDRLILSAGHASALYYSCAYMFNFGLTEADLKNFRKINSKTPGHPEYGVSSFTEASTGPLGQGIANAVGMAIGQTIIAERFNAQKLHVVDNYTYCFCGDGCLMEGVATEALSLAGNLKLNKLIILYDCNKVTIDGKLSITNSENVAQKFKAMGFNVIKVKNGNNYNRVTNAIAKAKRSTKKPTIIIFNTTIGYGTELAGLAEIHGKPLSQIELNVLKDNLNVTTSFSLPDDVKGYAMRSIRKNKILIEKWNRMCVIYQTTHPDLYKQLTTFMEDKSFDVTKLLKPEIISQNLSGRDANALILKEISSKMPRFVGGTADLAPSVKAYISAGGDYSAENRRGKNIHYGVREHGMGAICNGLTLYLKNPSFCATFLAFSNYMLPSIRMSALMNIPSMFMFSHDSYKVGEDGPTHQSIEQIGTLRAIPNLNVFRPADTNELLWCYQEAISGKSPSAFVLSKQKLNFLETNFKQISHGGYLLSQGKSDVVIFATGSEVELALDVKKALEKESIKVCVASFPCLEVFEKQTNAYKNSVLSAGNIKVAIEASNDKIWYKYTGDNGIVISVDEFGKSANSKDLDAYYGFTVTTICKRIKTKLKNIV